MSQQDDSQLQVQLFKLYHNEQEISNLIQDLKSRNKDVAKLEKRRQVIEGELKAKKQENARISRELAAIDKNIREKVGAGKAVLFLQCYM